MTTERLRTAFPHNPRSGAPRWPLAVFVLGLLALALLAWPALGHAADDPPGRVGRVAWVEGDAQLQRGDGGEPIEQRDEPLRNWPLTSGDLIRVADNGRAEIGIGSTRLRLGENSQLLLRRLDDESIDLELLSGHLAVLLRSDEVARELSIETRAARLLPMGAGLYRIDTPDAERGSRNGHGATAWRNGLRIEQSVGSYMLQPGQHAELYIDGGFRLEPPEADAFARWAMNNDDLQPLATRDAPVPDEMTGAQELDRHGDWTRSPDYGWVWYPRTVALGWAPYRYGRWSWVSPWGWTWIDDAPWGFAPFHYGRWVWWRDRWGWVPGDYTPRPVYAPALVVWNGSPGVSVSIGIGLGVAWYPLGPREVYVPPYRSGPRYIVGVNQPHVHDGYLLNRVIQRPDDVLRDTRFRYGQFAGAVSTGSGRDDRDRRSARPVPWQGRVELPPRILAPQAPPVVTRIRPDPRERNDRIDRPGFPQRPDMRRHDDDDRGRPGPVAPGAVPQPPLRVAPLQPPIQPREPQARPGFPQPAMPQQAAPEPAVRPPFALPPGPAASARSGARDDDNRRDDRRGDGRADQRNDPRPGFRSEGTSEGRPVPGRALPNTPVPAQAGAVAEPPQAAAIARPAAPMPVPVQQTPAAQAVAPVARPVAPQPGPAVMAAPAMQPAPAPMIPAPQAAPPPRPEQRIAVPMPRVEPPRPPDVRQEQRQEQRRETPRVEGRPDRRADPRQDDRRERWPPGREQ